jgi:uncharacterized protein (DUF488 family)
VTTLYTLGYTGLLPAQILQFCQSLSGFARIADIRDSPWSKHERWDFTSLTTNWGDRYRHVQSLGNMGRHQGRFELRDAAIGVQEIATLLHDGDVILLCACEEVLSCHRLRAAEACREGSDGLEVVHVTARELIDSTRKQKRMFS